MHKAIKNAMLPVRRAVMTDEQLGMNKAIGGGIKKVAKTVMHRSRVKSDAMKAFGGKY